MQDPLYLQQEEHSCKILYLFSMQRVKKSSLLHCNMQNILCETMFADFFHIFIFSL